MIDYHLARWKIQDSQILVDLSDAEEFIAFKLKYQTSPKNWTGMAPIVLTEGLTEIKTPLELNGFYFAFRVVIRNTTFKRALLTLNHAQFARGPRRPMIAFLKHRLNATAANFGPSTDILASAVLSRDASFDFATIRVGLASARPYLRKTANFHASIFNASNTFERRNIQGQS